MSSLLPSFWKNKRVLLTGHTGFKGSWLAIWLNRLGVDVVGVALPPRTTPNLFFLAAVDQICESHFCDIRNSERLLSFVAQVQPEIVFHLAAQPLVCAGYRDPVETFSSNVMGTVCVLEALRTVESVRVAVMVTTDKVYRDMRQSRPYCEEDVLGGYDPYSASKAASEIVIDCYRDSFLEKKGVSVASARAGNVIGGGDWSEARLLPDAIRSWQAGETFEVRRPQAVRPWQHVLEPLAGYLKLAETLWHRPELAGAYNFGPNGEATATVRSVVDMARNAYPGGRVSYGDGEGGFHETFWLSLDVNKSSQVLGLKPHWSLHEAVEHTMAWYRQQAAGVDARMLCESQIATYEDAL